MRTEYAKGKGFESAARAPPALQVSIRARATSDRERRCSESAADEPTRARTCRPPGAARVRCADFPDAGGRGARARGRCRPRRSLRWPADRDAAGWPVYRLSEHPRMCVRLDSAGRLSGDAGGQPALPGRGGGRAAAGDPGRRPRRGGPEPRRSPPHAAAGHRLSRRQRLHRARLRRLHRSFVAVDGGLGGIAVPGDRGLHRRPQPRLLAAEPDGELGQRPDRRRLAPDPDLRRAAGADQRLQQLRQDQPQPGDRAGRRRRRATRSRRRPRSGWAPAARSTTTWRPTRRPPAPPPRPSPSSRPGPKSCTRSATSPASTAAAPRGSRTSPTRSAAATTCPTTSGSPTGTARPTSTDPYVPANAWADHQRIHQYRGGHDETLRRRHDQHRQQLRRRRRRSATRRRCGERRPGRRLRLHRLPRPRDSCGCKGWALRQERADAAAGDPRLRRRPGRRAGRARARARPGRHPPAAGRRRQIPGGRSRSTASTPASPTVKSGPQPVCVYALNIGPGADRLLGCKTPRSRSRSPSPTRGRRQRGARPRRLRLAGRHRVPRPARAAHQAQGRDAAPTRSPRRGSGPSPARSAAAPSGSAASARTPSRSPQRRRPGAAAAARQAQGPADRRHPRRPPGRRRSAVER